MRPGRLPVAIVAAALAAVGLTACGGDDTPTLDGAKIIRVEVTETEFSIALSRKKFPAGTYVFTVINEGSTKHDLVIEGPGINKERTPVLESGEEKKLRVRLREGTYKMWCAVGSHRELGMEMQLIVGGTATTDPDKIGDRDY